MSKYLLDSSVLIELYRRYYPLDFALSFRRQLENILRLRAAIILKMVNDEIWRADDCLSNWLGDVKKDVKAIYKEIAILNWAGENIADPWLTVAAMDGYYKIVTREQGIFHAKIFKAIPKFLMPPKSLVFVQTL